MAYAAAHRAPARRTVTIAPEALELIGKLNVAVRTLPEKDVDFVASMVRGAQKYGNFTEKQLGWVHRMIEKAANPQAADDRPGVVRTQIGDMSGVMALFEKAGAKLKHPKVRLLSATEEPVVLSIAGPRSNAPGTVNVTDGGPYGSNKWYGRIDRNGVWARGAKLANAVDHVALLLTRLASEPEKVAAEYGKLTGNCCFCERKLDDARSTEVGYGPVCAKNWNLPWGK